jgi:hypothetical protein
MIKKVITLSLLTALFLTSCTKTKEMQTKENDTSAAKEEIKNNEDLVVGNWVEPNPINDKEVQGIEIIKGGDAKSINMATLLYSKWWIKDNQLLIVEESVGNKVSSIDTATFDIVKVDQDSLILKDQFKTVKYKKQ